jgi:hypothetical protein
MLPFAMNSVGVWHEFRESSIDREQSIFPFEIGASKYTQRKRLGAGVLPSVNNPL